MEGAGAGVRREGDIFFAGLNYLKNSLILLHQLFTA